VLTVFVLPVLLLTFVLPLLVTAIVVAAAMEPAPRRVDSSTNPTVRHAPDKRDTAVASQRRNDDARTAILPQA
jgi:hypothetical protein